MRLYTQAEKDALCDAEALLLAAEWAHMPGSGFPEALCPRPALLEAAVYGPRAVAKPYGHPSVVYAYAKLAASCAFKAVPALRVPDFESEEDK